MSPSSGPTLFSPIKIRDLTFKNRIFVSPMCQYSALDGVPGDWHFVHLGSRAVGGAALVLSEATAVAPEGRISPGDTGLWNEDQARSFARIAAFIKAQGAIPGVQLAHAGRKGSTAVPWQGGKALSQGGWEVLAPSAEKFAPDYSQPRAMLAKDIDQLLARFSQAAKLAFKAGLQVIELHLAHGYLLHEFLSPLSNRRTDEYGGSLENRMRLPLQVAHAVREAWPKTLPLFARISATDWSEGGWDLRQSVELCKRLKEIGVDLIDCSSGGVVPNARIATGPGYQVPFAEGIRKGAAMLTGAVGMITTAAQAEEILASGKADAVLLARGFLADPYWPLHAARELGHEMAWPVQYERAAPRIPT